jgi:hypothetical protein
MMSISYLSPTSTTVFTDILSVTLQFTYRVYLWALYDSQGKQQIFP